MNARHSTNLRYFVRQILHVLGALVGFGLIAYGLLTWRKDSFRLPPPSDFDPGVTPNAGLWLCFCGLIIIAYCVFAVVINTRRAPLIVSLDDISSEKKHRAGIPIFAVFLALFAACEAYAARQAQINHTVLLFKGSWFTPGVGYIFAFCTFSMALAFVVSVFRKSNDRH